MAVRTRPGFAVSVEKTFKGTALKTVFYDLRPGNNTFRFLPPDNEEGNLFFMTAQHYKLREEGNKRAFACLRVHGTEDQECPACVMIERAIEDDPERHKKIADSFGGSGVAYKWKAQVVPLPKEGVPVEQLYVIDVSKKVAGDISNILKMENDNRQTLLTDPDAGQAITIVHNGKSGNLVRYSVLATGIRVPLDEIYPKWTTEFLNIQKAIGLRIVSPTRIAKSLQETYPALFAKYLADFKFDDEDAE